MSVAIELAYMPLIPPYDKTYQTLFTVMLGNHAPETSSPQIKGVANRIEIFRRLNAIKHKVDIFLT